MDDFSRNPSSGKAKRYQRNRKSFDGSGSNRAGRHGSSERRSKRSVPYHDAHNYNRTKIRKTMVEIQKLLQEVIITQKRVIVAMEEHRDREHRISLALEVIAAKLQ